MRFAAYLPAPRPTRAMRIVYDCWLSRRCRYEKGCWRLMAIKCPLGVLNALTVPAGQLWPLETTTSVISLQRDLAAQLMLNKVEHKL
jgi:hypothetical protein